MINILLLNVLLILASSSHEKLTFNGRLLTLSFNVSHAHLPLPLQPYLHHNP